MFDDAVREYAKALELCPEFADLRVQLGNDGPRRTVQLVIYGRTRKVGRVQWTFAHTTPGAAARKLPPDEPQLPL